MIPLSSGRRRMKHRRRCLSTEPSNSKCTIYSTPTLALPSCVAVPPPFGGWRPSPLPTAPFPPSPVTNCTLAWKNAKILPKSRTLAKSATYYGSLERNSALGAKCVAKLVLGLTETEIVIYFFVPGRERR
jgi:hypothetical protein